MNVGMTLVKLGDSSWTWDTLNLHWRVLESKYRLASVSRVLTWNSYNMVLVKHVTNWLVESNRLIPICKFTRLHITPISLILSLKWNLRLVIFNVLVVIQSSKWIHCWCGLRYVTLTGLQRLRDSVLGWETSSTKAFWLSLLLVHSAILEITGPIIACLRPAIGDQIGILLPYLSDFILKRRLLSFPS